MRPMPRRLLRIEKAGQFVNHAVGEAASLQSEARRSNEEEGDELVPTASEEAELTG